VGVFRTPLALLMPAFALPSAPAVLAVGLRSVNGTLPYPSVTRTNAIASVAGLSPGTLSAPDHSTSELLRTL
jgi:hypothetical protein